LAQLVEGRAPVRGDVDVVLGQGQRLREQIANAGLVVYDENARPPVGLGSLADRPDVFGAARSLAVEPRIDVALAEAPLAADPDRRNLSRLDEAINGPQVDLQILEHLFRREKRFVN